jgi:hypothetical protein
VTCPTVFLNGTAAATWRASDNVSGVAGATSGTIPLDTSALGPHSVTVSVVDNVGHTGSSTCSYNVVFNFVGFFAPVNNMPTLNIAKPGSAIPVKFRLGGNQGLTIFAPGYPKVITIACVASAPVDPVELIVTSSTSQLTYDAIADQYTYTWKTSPSYTPGTCNELVLQFVDGTTRRADFKWK